MSEPTAEELSMDGRVHVREIGLDQVVEILSLHRDSRAEVLQALREVYDGLYTRDVGTDGGKRLRWEGRCSDGLEPRLGRGPQRRRRSRWRRSGVGRGGRIALDG